MLLRFQAVLLSSFLLFSSLVFSEGPLQSAPVQELIKDQSEFAFSLYSQLKGGEANVVFSPYSIFSCLSMVYVGAKGDTAEEIKTALHLFLSQNGIGKTSSLLAKALFPLTQDPSDYELHMANGMWFDKDTFILSDFRHLIADEFGANLQSLDFSQPNDALEKINDWTANQTQGKITNFLKLQDIDSSTRVLLTNALYFKGSWNSAFDPKKTALAPFFNTPDTSIQVAMMQQTENLLYFQDDQVQVLGLPFASKHPSKAPLACLFVLPAKEQPLSDVEASISQTVLKRWLSTLKETYVHATLPKFTLNQMINLNQALQTLGIKTAFSKDANFSRMDGMRDLFLNKVLHQTYFALDEFGVTAAATTSASLSMKGVLEKNSPIDFTANHPFLFMIVDLKSEAVLFMGRLGQMTP